MMRVIGTGVAIGLLGALVNGYPGLLFGLFFGVAAELVRQRFFGPPPGSSPNRERVISEISTMKDRKTGGNLPRGLRATRGGNSLQWVLPGELLKIQGWRIASGLLYTCDGPPRLDEASAINTKLRTERPATGEANQLGYWPRYSDLTPAQRGSYLEWLSNDRFDEDPRNRELGHVFLFFYGLERRLLIDKDDDPRIEAALIEMLARYGGIGRSKSLQSYTCQLLHFAATMRGWDAYGRAWPKLISLRNALLGEDELSMILAELHSSRKPLPVELARELASRDPDSRKSVVVQRVPEEFDELFRKRYSEKFPEGLSLKAAKRDLTIRYHPASPTLTSISYTSTHPESLALRIPNIRGIKSQFRPLREIWNACIEDLSAYSRAIGKSDDQRTLKSHLALPEELKSAAEHPFQEEWSALLEGSGIDQGLGVVVAGQIATYMGIAYRPRLTMGQSRKICDLAQSLGYLVEPDARSFGGGYAWDQQIGIFENREEEFSPPGRAVLGALALLRLAVFVAYADGRVDDGELDICRRMIEKSMGLSKLDHHRLKVHEELLVRDPIGAQAGLPKIVAHIPDEGKAAVAHLLVEIAALDGVITRDEHRALRRACRVLNYSGRNLDQLILHVEKEFSEKVILEAGSRRKGESIPEPSRIDQEPGVVEEFDLDMAKIDRISRETREVIGILARALDEESLEAAEPALSSREETDEAKQANEGKAPHWMEDLHASCRPLLIKLLARDSWDQSEFDSLAGECGLLPLGALESINEWADEFLGDFILVGDDPILVERSLVPESENAS